MRRSWSNSAKSSSEGPSPVALMVNNLSERWGQENGPPPMGAGQRKSPTGERGGSVLRCSHEEDAVSAAVASTGAERTGGTETAETSTSRYRQVDTATVPAAVSDDGSGGDGDCSADRQRPSPLPLHRGRRSDNSGGSSTLLGRASAELEKIRNRSPSPGPSAAAAGEFPACGHSYGIGARIGSSSGAMENMGPFPPACRQLLVDIEGNTRCLDCGDASPDWASVSYGALLCLGCSGKHRSLGVKTSFVRSISMDHWSTRQILSMLEGGNHQLSQFFSRHALPHTMGTARYRTVAARFYREKLAEHVEDVLGRGEYRGRDKNRQKKKGDTRSESKSSTQSTNGSGAVPREGIATGTDATRERSRSQPRGGGSPAAGAAKKEAKQAEGRRARSCSAEPRNGSEKQLRRSVTTL